MSDASGTITVNRETLRLGLLLAGETVNSIGGWASAIVLWGVAAYRFCASAYSVSVIVMCWAAPAAVLSPLMVVCVYRLGPKAALAAGYVAAAASPPGHAAARPTVPTCYTMMLAGL